MKYSEGCAARCIECAQLFIAHEAAMGKAKDKYNEIHAKLAAKFGDEKTAKVEKVLIALLILLFLWMLISFVLPLVPFVILGLFLYWYFTVYRKKGASTSTADVQTAMVKTAVDVAANNPELAVAALKSAAGAAAAGTTAAPPPPNPPKKLPEPWTEMQDPGSGKPYYYNTATGETQWTVPKS